MNNLNHIGTYIAMYRKNKSITQKELSILVNVTKSTVSMWECCRRVPNRQDFYKLCEVLNIPVEFFFPIYLKSFNNYDQQG